MISLKFVEKKVTEDVPKPGSNFLRKTPGSENCKLSDPGTQSSPGYQQLLFTAQPVS